MGEREFWETFTEFSGPIDVKGIQRIDGFEHWYAWVERPPAQHSPSDRIQFKLYIVFKGKHRIMCTLHDPANAKGITFHSAKMMESASTLVEAVYLTEDALGSGNKLFSQSPTFRGNAEDHYNFIMAAMNNRHTRSNCITASWLLSDSS